MMSRFGWQKTARVLHRRIVDDGRIAPASNLTEHLHEQEHLKGMTSLDAVENWTAVRGGKVQPSPDSPGKVLYKVDDISFVMRAPSAH